jgi:hemerythrin
MDYPQVALEFMNRDHAEFVALRDSLLGQLDACPPAAAVDALLDELLSHTRHHFAEEERLMREVNFPPFPVHKGEHDAVLRNMSTRVEDWKQDRDAERLRAWLDKDVGDWFVDHVSTMDFVTARFIAAQRPQ